jgi:hypothetical protein
MKQIIHKYYDILNINSIQMKFTIEIKSGFCNVLKSFVTALSISETNLIPSKRLHFDADWSKIIDNSLICHNKQEMYESFISARFLILKEEEYYQKDLINDTKIWGSDLNGGINILNKNLIHLFSKHTIDWFFDRNLICDKVFNRIQSGINKVIWKTHIIEEVKKITSKFSGRTLTVQIRTWTHESDPKNIFQINDGVRRYYSFKEYTNAIDKCLFKTDTIFLTADNQNVISDYLNYLKGYNIIQYTRPNHLSELEYSAVTMLVGSAADMLICNRLSTYAECMWWFGGCKSLVIPVG